MQKSIKPYLFASLSLISIFTLIATFIVVQTPTVTLKQTHTYHLQAQTSGIGPVSFEKPNVLPSIRNAYDASVAILDLNGRVICSGTIINNRPGEPFQVITAWHCVQGAFPGTVAVGLIHDGHVVPMVVQKKAEAWDLAILVGLFSVENAGPQADLGQRDPQLGETIWIIGNPRGIVGNITKGILSNILQIRHNLRYYRVDAQLYYGNSGGGMFNSYGELVGVAVAVEFDRGRGGSSQMVPGGGICVSLYNIKQLITS